MMAHAGLIDPYDLEQIAAAPPDAIVYDHRVHYWMLQFPRLGAFVQQHYVPLFQGLWIPGMSVVLEPESAVVRWVAPVSGQYDVWSSPVLASHPWMTHRHQYGFLAGVDLGIPLDQLPRASDERLRWVVDGVAVPDGLRTLNLQRGSRVELHASVGSRTGVMLVPHGIRMLSIMPEVRFFL
jgi:hypothetical protein